MIYFVTDLDPSGLDLQRLRPRPALAVEPVPLGGSMTLYDAEAQFRDVVCAPFGRRGGFAVAT